ncbi:MAG: DUF1015 domain-containing protein [Candidatus Thorarchaeota archaeon]|nr:MAG: DUF1015 domain-containing protein [Candidatus Thorarchaeota archaeon]RLI60774.1 MAG: DUF1015 domain-containing protein [Candidatus Thorarchaeota archaeon]
MVRVIPFRAYRYNEAKAGDLSKLVSPPYDIIKGEKIDKLQSMSPYNIAWIIRNKPQPTDTESNNQYTRARDLLNKWVDEGILVQDDSESFYVYGQDFEVYGRKLFRFGFIGLIELEEFATEAPRDGKFSGVLQHEETLPKDIQDRLNLCRQALAQFGQIFVIYPDHEGAVDAILLRAMEKDPIADVTDYEGVRHRLWRIDDPQETSRITELMRDKYVIIADGHHRYKTALALAKERPDIAAARYRMMTFVNMANPGLVVLPTHRLVQNLEDFSVERLLLGIREHFDVDTFENREDMFKVMEEKFNSGEHAFGLFVDDGNFYVLTLRDVSIMDEVLPDKSKELRQLDVSILHALILDRILGIDKEKLAQGTMSGSGYVVYIKGIGNAADEAIQAVKNGAQAVFFMNPTRVEEVEAVSRNFEVMPQKSTFFQPKVWTGFTINKLT